MLLNDEDGRLRKVEGVFHMVLNRLVSDEATHLITPPNRRDVIFNALKQGTIAERASLDAEVLLAAFLASAEVLYHNWRGV